MRCVVAGVVVGSGASGGPLPSKSAKPRRRPTNQARWLLYLGNLPAAIQPPVIQVPHGLSCAPRHDAAEDHLPEICGLGFNNRKTVSKRKDLGPQRLNASAEASLRVRPS